MKYITIILLLCASVAQSQVASVSISVDKNCTCSGDTITFTATVTNGGPNVTYQWYGSSNTLLTGATNSTYKMVNLGSTSIYCKILNPPDLVQKTSNVISVNVYNNGNVGPLNISGSPNRICVGGSLLLTATTSACNLSYQWYIDNVLIPGATSRTYTFNETIPKSYIVKVVETSNSSCNWYNTITITVYSWQTPTITISGEDTVCKRTPTLYTSTQTYGGINSILPSYAWTVNDTLISLASTLYYSPKDNDVIKCDMTSNYYCRLDTIVSSNIITTKVNDCNAVYVSISSPTRRVMSGVATTFTANYEHGGTSPSFQWLKNNTIVSGATNSTYHYTPLNNDVIKCILTSNEIGVINNPDTSNSIPVIVYTTGSACTGVPTVTHGGKIYNSVQIGMQCWLRESMDVGTRIDAATTQTNNAVVEKWCYDNDTMNCNVYGGLYQWAEMVQYLNGATNTTNWSPVPTGNVQGICPTGWHIPKQSEWNTLITYLGGMTLAGGPMKSAGYGESVVVCPIRVVGWTWNIPNHGATNSSGLSMLPGGWYDRVAFGFRGYANLTWTASQPTGANQTVALYFGTTFVATNMLGGQGYKTTGYSVRCLKD